MDSNSEITEENILEFLNDEMKKIDGYDKVKQ